MGPKVAIAALLIGAAAAAHAQSAGGMRRIGILSPTSLTDPTAREWFSVLTNRLRELGYIEGKNLSIEWAFAEGKAERLPVFAGELVKAGVEVIVTSGTPATSAAKRATDSVPIVAASFGDPVASGFAQSLPRPGGNVTGFSTMGGVIYEKRLDLLVEAVPSATRIGLLINPDNNFFLRILPALQAWAEKRGRTLHVAQVNNAKTLDEGFGQFQMRRVGAVLVFDDSQLNTLSGKVAAHAKRYKLPALCSIERCVEDGGLIGYTTDAKYRYRRVADYVDRILKGEKPSGMPIEQPVNFELTVNKKTAAELGITVPPAILARASRTIE